MAGPGAWPARLTGWLGAAAFAVGFGYAALARLGVLLPALRPVREQNQEPGAGSRAAPSGLSVTFLVPAREEHLVVGRAIRSMLACAHDGVRVLAVVDAGDPRTVEAAEGADDGSGRLRVVRDPGGRDNGARGNDTRGNDTRGNDTRGNDTRGNDTRGNGGRGNGARGNGARGNGARGNGARGNGARGKGAALAAALPLVDSEVVGVFDADSVVRPGLLGPVERAFAGGADVTQVPVRPRWRRVGGWHGTRTLLDYAAWSRGRAGTTTGVVRLSGTGIFFRTALLRAVGGWRPSLTEDFDLALRLTAAGARITVLDRPEIATDEEVPRSARSLLRQRVRWHQGFLEILATGAWRRLPTVRMRAAALGPALVPVGRALAAAGAVLVVVAALAGGPAPGAAVVVPAVALAGLVPTVDAVVFARVAPGYGVHPSTGRLAALVLGAVPFYAVSAAASVLAVARQLAGRHAWETTAHGAAE